MVATRTFSTLKHNASAHTCSNDTSGCTYDWVSNVHKYLAPDVAEAVKAKLAEKH
jgi:hypothetical protein